MRIISGNFRGKKLFQPKDKSTRPLRDLVKEAIFNLIHHSKKLGKAIKGSSILDLFSGSGSFGIECLSRGAEKVFFFEKNNKALEVLEKNLNSLKNIRNFEIYKNDVFHFFEGEHDLEKKFDIIFIDPPYKENKVNLIIETTKKRKLLKPGGIMILHRNKKDENKLSKEFNILEERDYGVSKILFGN